MPLQKPWPNALAPAGTSGDWFISHLCLISCLLLESPSLCLLSSRCFWGWDAWWAGSPKERKGRGKSAFPFPLLKAADPLLCDLAWGDMVACLTEQQRDSTNAQLVEQWVYGCQGDVGDAVAYRRIREQALFRSSKTHIHSNSHPVFDVVCN